MDKRLPILLIIGCALLTIFVVKFTNLTTAEFDSAEDLIKSFEGFRGGVYKCPAGVKTIGYGFTDEDLVAKGTITREEADKVLSRKVAKLRNSIVWDLKEFNRTLGKHELDAVTSFVYNVGWSNWKSSTMREKIICGDIKGAADEFPRWKYVGGKLLTGLVRRREAERRMFKRG